MIAHKWWIIVGDVGLVTHDIGTAVAKSPRHLSNYAAVLSLFDPAPARETSANTSARGCLDTRVGSSCPNDYPETASRFSIGARGTVRAAYPPAP